MASDITILYLNAGDRELESPRKLAGILRHAKTQGWRVEAFRRRDVSAREVPALLRRCRPAGCIVEDTDSRQRLSPLIFGNLPVVYLDSSVPEERRGVPLVLCDNAAVAERAFLELSSGDPPAFAAVPSPSLVAWNHSRIETFAALCAGAGRPCLIFPGKCDEDIVQRSVRLAAWISSLPPHTAIFALNDYTAKGVAEAATGLGFRFPRDFTLVGVDAIPETDTESTAPGISSVELDFEFAGYLAAKLLEKIIVHKSATANCAQAPNCKSKLEFDNCGQLSQLQIASNTFGPLLVLRRESARGRGRREPHILEAVEIIRREACDGLTAAALAARFRVSRGHFERRFREAMGHSVLDEILHVRMESAITLLASRGMPLSAITQFCGFGTDQELRRLFRKHFGCSMREWRSRHMR